MQTESLLNLQQKTLFCFKNMKELTKFILITSSIILIGYFVINYLFFKKSLDYEPEITGLKESNFEFTSSKPFFYQVDRNLFYSADGKLSYNQAPIWKGEIGEAFISPDNNFALIYFDYK